MDMGGSVTAADLTPTPTTIAFTVYCIWHLCTMFTDAVAPSLVLRRAGLYHVWEAPEVNIESLLGNGYGGQVKSHRARDVSCPTITKHT